MPRRAEASAAAAQQSTVPLRHGRRAIWPSEIGDQAYCEYKVHLEQTHPEVQVEFAALDLGSAGHAALESVAVPVSEEEILAAVRKGKEMAVAEWTLGAIHDGVALRGRPDLFRFAGRKAQLMLEFKFSTARMPFPNHRLQVATYGLMAAGMGFDTSTMMLGVILLPPGAFTGGLKDLRGQKEAMLQYMSEEGVLQDIVKQCLKARKSMMAEGATVPDCAGDGWTAHLQPYQHEDASRSVSRALEYWRGQREPAPETRFPRKCAACPFNAAGLCEHALAAPQGFKLKPLADGRLLARRSMT